MGDGDVDPRADCLHRATCDDYKRRDAYGVGFFAACPECARYRPAAPPTPVAPRHCRVCGADKPTAAFRNRWNICDDCRQAAAAGSSAKPAGSAGGATPRRRQAAAKRAARQAAEASADVPTPEPPPAPDFIPTKQCTRCDETKDLADFGPYDGTIDGHDFLCSACRALATAEREKRAAAEARKNLAGEYAGHGECPRCGAPDQNLYVVAGGNGGGAVCYTCLLKRGAARKRAAAAAVAGGV